MISFLAGLIVGWLARVVVERKTAGLAGAPRIRTEIPAAVAPAWAPAARLNDTPDRDPYPDSLATYAERRMREQGRL